LSVARRLHERRGEHVDVSYLPQDDGPTTFTLPLTSIPLLSTPNRSGLDCLETPQWLAAADGTWGWAMGPDCFAVYVGGPDAVVDAVLAEPALAADEVSPDHPFDQVWLGGEPTGPWYPPP
jgi:hypothetical protein